MHKVGINIYASPPPQHPVRKGRMLFRIFGRLACAGCLALFFCPDRGFSTKIAAFFILFSGISLFPKII